MANSGIPVAEGDSLGNAKSCSDRIIGKNKYLVMDRDAKFSEAFRAILEQAGVEAVRLPPCSPNLNPNLERFMRSVKEECLERMIFFGEASLRTAISEFLSHYHLERNHQGLENRLITPMDRTMETAGTVQRRQRLGGMLNYYYREAA